MKIEEDGLPHLRYTPDRAGQLKSLWTGDVIVVGGGSAGSAAAIAAARRGARTLLVESGAFLGGTGARVLDTFYGFYAPGRDALRVVGGIGWEVCQRLSAMDQSFERPNTYGAGTGVTYEPEALKLVWDQLVTGSGADLLLYALATGVIVDEEERLCGVVVETKAGPRRLTSHVVVDATGDAEICWRAGATTANAPVERLQPATATFRVGGVRDDAVGTAELHRLMEIAAAEGTYALPRVEGSAHATCLPGVKHTNLTRVTGKDLSDPWQLTWAEQEGRRQVWEYMRFLAGQVPGYESSYLLNASSRLGVRESRRLVGEYVLDRPDFVGPLSHSDDIGRCGAPVEDHSAGRGTRWEYVGGHDQPDGSTYGIPFGSLLPRTVDNLVVAGRCLSATHDAHASVRSMGQCMAMGQAAGTAAAMSADRRSRIREVDRDELRDHLREAEAILDESDLAVRA